MKKIISAFVLMGVTTLTACGNSNNEQVTESTLVTTVAETTMATETTVEETTTTEATTTTVEVTTTMEETTTIEELTNLPAFIADKHDLTYRVDEYGDAYSATLYNLNADKFKCILVVETIWRKGAIPDSMVYMYDTDGTLLFENSSMFTAGAPEVICIVEDNGVPTIIVELCQSRAGAIYKYNITETGVVETFCGYVDTPMDITGLNTDVAIYSVNETKDEVTYYVTIDGEEKVLYKAVHTDNAWKADYSVSELPFAEVTEVYNASDIT